MALMKKLTSAIVASSLVLGLVGTAGATTPDKVQNAADRMLKLALINGVTPGANPPDLALNANLTRAQLVTILVRAFGQEANAKFLNGAASFPDAANHPWASGYIAMAKQIIAQRSAGREVVGMPDGNFLPDGNVTAAEAVAFLMKFTGAPADTTLAWPDSYIQGALNAGLITAEDKEVLLGIKNAPATRGLAFYLADRTFYGYKLVEGGTTYTTFVDNVKPALTVDAVPATTLEEQVIVTGTVANDAVAVHVGAMDNAATIANGKFTATVNLVVGENKILVHAVDLAGNAAEQTVTVNKTVGTAASIEAADITVGAGEAVDVAAAVKDAKGNVIADAEVTGETTGETPIGTYADGKFTAGEKAGEGTLTLKSGELTKEVKVTVTAGALSQVAGEKPSVAPGDTLKLLAQDKFGNTVEGATFSEDSADAVVEGSIFIATKPGSYTVKATKGDVTVESKIGVYGEIEKFAVSAPESIVGNDASEITVTVSAVDKEGNVVGDYDGVVTVVDADLTAGDESVEALNGVATFTFSAVPELAGAVAVASFEDTEDSSISGSFEVDVEAQKATKIEIDAPEYLPTNDEGYETEVGVSVLDQAGETMAEGGWDFDIKVTGNAELENGKQTATEFLSVDADTFVIHPAESGEQGTVEITVSAEGLTSATATVKAAFAKEKDAVSLSVNRTSRTVDGEDDEDGEIADGRIFKFTAQLTDRNGVPVTDEDVSDNLKVKFEDVANKAYVFISKDEGDSWEALELDESTADLNILAEGGEVDFWVAGSVADTFKVSVTDPEGVLKSSAVQEVTLTADDPAVVGFASGTTNIQVAKTGTGEITAQAYDRFGNKAAVNGIKVTFAHTGDYDGVRLNGSAKDATVRTDANGVATVDVSIAATAEDMAATFELVGEYSGGDLATIDGEDMPDEFRKGSKSATMDVVMTDDIPESITATFVDEDDDRISSYKLEDEGGDGYADGFSMKVVVRDDLGVGVDFLHDAFDIDSDSAVDPIVDEASGEDGVYYINGFSPDATGAFSVTVSLPSYGNIKATKTIAVKAGDAVGFEVAEATSTTGGQKLIIDENELTPFTVRLVDAWDNAASGSSDDIRIDFVPDADGAESMNNREAFVDVRDADGTPIDYLDLKNGRTTAKFYVLTNALDATLTLTGTVNDEASTIVLEINPTDGGDIEE